MEAMRGRAAHWASCVAGFSPVRGLFCFWMIPLSNQGVIDFRVGSR